MVDARENMEFALLAFPDQVDPTEAVHALIPRTNTGSPYLPKGATKADEWILRHGDPLRSVDAALFLLNEVARDVKSYNVTINTESHEYSGQLKTHGRPEETIVVKEAATLPVLITLFAVKHSLQRYPGVKNVLR